MSIDTMSTARTVEALVQDYGRLVFHAIYGLTGDWQESQDFTQDTFLQAQSECEQSSLPHRRCKERLCSPELELQASPCIKLISSYMLQSPLPSTSH
jgi:hypothetical protein